MEQKSFFPPGHVIKFSLKNKNNNKKPAEVKLIIFHFLFDDCGII